MSADEGYRQTDGRPMTYFVIDGCFFSECELFAKKQLASRLNKAGNCYVELIIFTTFAVCQVSDVT